jgi:Secretion system C-terminal sorting domain
MKTLLKTLMFFLFLFYQCRGQGIMDIKTDKSNYSYGDSIEVRVTIANNTDTSFSIWGSSSCIARIGFNSVPFQIACTADYTEFKFLPHTARTWIWNLKPDVLGIPDKNGEQNIYAYCGGYRDSTTITAPKYYGGRLALSYKITVPKEEIQKLRDSLNASVLYSDTLKGLGVISEEWQIKNYSVDSLVNVYTSDTLLEYIEVERPLHFINEIVSSVRNPEEIPEEFVLYQNFPNPFNPSTTISYKLSVVCQVDLNIYNLIGKKVAVLVNERQKPGVYEIDFNSWNLPSGVYFYKLKAGQFIQTKKMILLK